VATPIFIIENHEEVREMLVTLTSRSGSKIKAFASAENFLATANFSKGAIYLIGCRLPGMDGKELIKIIRTKDHFGTIFIIADNSEDEDISSGLHSGADDCFVKPFNSEHLLIKLDNAKAKSLSMGKVDLNHGLKLVPLGSIISIDGKMCKLTPREFKILEFLYLNRGQVVSRQEILKHIRCEINEHTIDSHMHGLRKKIRALPIVIHAPRGMGYRLNY
jgi:OmpR-family two-component system manganese-sensing response regulator